MPRSCPFLSTHPPFLGVQRCRKRSKKTWRHRLNPLSQKNSKTANLRTWRRPFNLNLFPQKYTHFVSFLQSGPPGTGIFWDPRKSPTVSRIAAMSLEMPLHTFELFHVLRLKLFQSRVWKQSFFWRVTETKGYWKTAEGHLHMYQMQAISNWHVVIVHLTTNSHRETTLAALW